MTLLLKIISLSTLFSTPSVTLLAPTLNNSSEKNDIPMFYDSNYFTIKDETLLGVKYYEGSENANTLWINSESLGISNISSLLHETLPPTIKYLFLNNTNSYKFNIEDSAFCRTNISKIDLSGNEFDISSNAFSDCFNLVQILDNAPIVNLGTSCLNTGTNLELYINNQATMDNLIKFFPQTSYSTSFDYEFYCENCTSHDCTYNHLSKQYNEIVTKSLANPLSFSKNKNITNLTIASSTDIVIPDNLQNNIDNISQMFLSSEETLSVEKRTWTHAQVNGWGSKKTIYRNTKEIYTTIKYDTTTINGLNTLYGPYAYVSYTQNSDTTSSDNDFGTSVRFSTGESVRWRTGHYNWFWPASWIDGHMDDWGQGYW